MLDNVDRVVEKESTEETVRSYQLLFAKYIYEAGTEGYLQQSFRQDHQAMLGHQDIERAELPVIESFEADCQQYQIVYRSELYSTGRVNKVRLLEEQQKLSLGDAVVKQLVKGVRQEFHHACDVYRELYAADLRDDGQLDDEVLEREQDRWGLGTSIVQAIASTEQSTYTSDHHEYRQVAAQAIHQTGHFEVEPLRSLQLQFSFGQALLERIHGDVQAEFQTHVETYHQQFLDMLRHNGTITEGERSRLHDLCQSLGNLNPSLLAEFEATAIDTHEQNVVAYAAEARQVIQQFTNGNVSEPTPEEQESLLALSHWYDLSPAIAAQIERVVRAELSEQQPALESAPQSHEPAPQSEPAIESSEPSLVMATDEMAQPEEAAQSEGITSSIGSMGDAIDEVEAVETEATTEVTQGEALQQIEAFQSDEPAEDHVTLVTSEEDTETAEAEPIATADTGLMDLASPQDSQLEEEPISPEITLEPVTVSDTSAEAMSEDESVADVVPSVTLSEGAAHYSEEAKEAEETEDTPPENVSSVMAESIPETPQDIPEATQAITEAPQDIAATSDIAEVPQDVTPEDVQGIVEMPQDDEISGISDVSAPANTLASDSSSAEREKGFAFTPSQTSSPSSGNSKRILAVGASILGGVALIGGAIAMFRGLGRENPVPTVDLQSNTVEIAQSGTNPVVLTTEATSESQETTNVASTPEAIAAETMATFTEVQQLIQDRQVVSGLELLATVPSSENTAFEVEGILRQVFQQAEAYYQEGLYAEATTVTSIMGQLFPKQKISEQARIASKEWQNRWHANLALLKVAEDALEKQQYDNAIAKAQKVSHPGLQIQVATIIDSAIQAKQEQAALAEQARQNRVPPQSGSPAPRATVAPRSAPAPAPAPRPAPRATPQPAPQSSTPSQSKGYYSPDPL